LKRNHFLWIININQNDIETSVDPYRDLTHAVTRQIMRKKCN